MKFVVKGNMQDDIQKRNRKTLTTILMVVAVMVGASFAAVPAYRAFCQLTGFDGTTQVSTSVPPESDILDRTVTIKFNTDVARNMLWSFHADQHGLDLRLGQQGMMTFNAENRDRVSVTGTAIYNVTPPKVGKYFHKTQCFCFGSQTLKPGEKATFPVVFYIDPAMDKDPNLIDVKTITLSYTFFPSDTPELEAAMEDFYNQAETAGTVALKPEKQ